MTGAPLQFHDCVQSVVNTFHDCAQSDHFSRGVERLDAEVAVTRKEWIQKEKSDGPEEEEGSIERPTMATFSQFQADSA
jgi:hypothetical protein